MLCKNVNNSKSQFWKSTNAMILVGKWPNAIEECKCGNGVSIYLCEDLKKSKMTKRIS